MPLGRPLKPERTQQWCFRVPDSIASKWDLILTDPTTGRIMPNVKQEIFIPLLARIWDAAMQGQTTIDVSDIVASIHQRLEPL